ncbi:hypothetical protein GGE65_006378 [Skermanella aerolata]
MATRIYNNTISYPARDGVGQSDHEPYGSWRSDYFLGPSFAGEGGCAYSAGGW